jgi:hypothetical protein
VQALAELMRTITAADIQRARQCIPSHDLAFDRDAQIARVTAFLNELLDRG